MAGLRRLIAVGLPIIGCLLVSSCENPLFDTVRIMVEEATDPLLVSYQPDPGTFTVPQSVQLTASKIGATIRYTTDGSEPTATHGTLYAGEIDVTASTTIRARAYLDPYSDSEVAVGAFTIPFGGQTKRFALTPEVDAEFGTAVAIDGDYAIVGAPFEDGGGDNRGAAYIFHRTGPDTWDAGVRIQALVPVDDHRFGYSVDIDGDYAIVGKPEVFGQGEAYIFHRTGTNTWDSGYEIAPPAVVFEGYFGHSVAISGDYAVVGAFGENGGIGGSHAHAGAAYIFHRTGPNTWGERYKITASGDGMDGDNFGRSVSISGDTIAVGAPYWNITMPATSDVGRAYAFLRTGTNTWDWEDWLDGNVDQAGAEFGWSVDISGDYAIVGAHNEDEGAFSFAGAAYLFHHQAAYLWELSSRIVATDPASSDYFGSAVAISGDYAISAAKMEDEVADRAGAIYSYHRTATSTWNAGPTAKWTAFDGGLLQFFGCSVGIDGMYAIVGAVGCPGPASETGAGAAYILH
jgi:hypothetical protein